MKEGTFNAVGMERPAWRHPALLLPLLGALTGALLIVLVFPLLYYLAAGDNFELGAFLGGLFMLGASFVAVGALRLRYYRVTEMKISYEDARDQGGNLRLAYASPTHRQRNCLQVKRVEGNPDMPLMRASYIVIAEKGTQSTISIYFTNELILVLGFPDKTSMYHVFAMLKERNQPSPKSEFHPDDT